MKILEGAVQELEKRIKGSGCDEGAFGLFTDPDVKICQYERGVCMMASYGGKSAEFITFEPTRAKTRLSFMFGATFENSRTGAAACAIINAVTGFLCINRTLHSCNPECHAPCLYELKEHIKGRTLFIFGSSQKLEYEFRNQLVSGMDAADITIFTGDGIISGMDEGMVEKQGKEREVLFISPSTSGIASLGNSPYWCPYGRG
jgi:hypothetical protein